MTGKNETRNRAKDRAARWSNTKHRWLALVGGISLLVWGLSGLTHIAMVLFGPQQAQFMPPTAPLTLAGAPPLAQTLAEAGIGRAAAIRTVAGQEGSLLQVTSDPMAPRRYFDVQQGTELPGHDRVQAVFLARHFLNDQRPIAAIDFQQEFDAEYPLINRLLPVWRVRFAGDDRLTAYVHTETSSIAAVNNVTKTRLQTVFRYLHTWEWVPASMDWLRVMMFSLSGLYHLIQSANEPPVQHLRMTDPIDLSGQRFPIAEQWDQLTAGLDVASVSLVEGANGRPLYRLGLAAPTGKAGMAEHDHSGDEKRSSDPHAGHMMAGDVPNPAPTTAQEIRNARFDGVQPTGPAYYIDAATGAAVPHGDREIARVIANRYLGASDAQIAGMKLITRFGAEHDFRNKRLPVWRVDYGAPHDASVFIDTATGTFVDRLDNWQKPERTVFSMVHKWNFLFPIGRTGLNAVVGGIVIALIVLMGVLGLRMYLRGRRGRARHARG